MLHTNREEERCGSNTKTGMGGREENLSEGQSVSGWVYSGTLRALLLRLDSGRFQCWRVKRAIPEISVW